jgi:transposase InsO family protein
VLHEEERFPVSRVCKRCGRSTVVYYKGRKTRARLANKEDFILLLARRERIVNPMAGCEKVLYAIRPAMAEEGVSMGGDRFYKLMKANGMMVPKRRKYSCTTTKQDKSLVPSPNLVKDMEINAPDQALCSDITYIYTEEGFLFLSLMMDMYVHDIVGWEVRESLKTEGPLEALAMASRTLKPGAKPVAHSDRGCQHNSHAYIEALEKLGWKSSMTEELHCYENAMAERLNGILKYEYFLDTHFKTKKEASKAIEEAIRIYNTRRLHEKCGYKTPSAFREEAMRKAA